MTDKSLLNQLPPKPKKKLISLKKKKVKLGWGQHVGIKWEHSSGIHANIPGFCSSALRPLTLAEYQL